MHKIAAKKRNCIVWRGTNWCRVLWLVLISSCLLTFIAAGQTGGPARSVVLKIKKIIGRLDQIQPQSGQVILRVDNERHVLRVAADCRLGDEMDELNALSELRKNELVYAVCTEEPTGLVAHRIARVHPKPAKAKSSPGMRAKDAPVGP